MVYTVLYTAILAALLTAAGMMHALHLPGRDSEARELAANFLQYQRAAQKAGLKAVQEAAQETVSGAGSDMSLPDPYPFLPPGYAALGDWDLKTDGSVLYVWGKTGSSGRTRLALKDVWELAKKKTGTGIKQGCVLVPWSAIIPAGIAAAIPEGAVVMLTRLK